MTEVYIAVSVARQEGGDYILVKTEKAFKDKTKADSYVNSKQAVWREQIENIWYMCERSILTVELE